VRGDNGTGLPCGDSDEAGDIGEAEAICAGGAVEGDPADAAATEGVGRGTTAGVAAGAGAAGRAPEATTKLLRGCISIQK
jgi:hypothetical protein